jgi:hypothetical protein
MISELDQFSEIFKAKTTAQADFAGCVSAPPAFLAKDFFWGLNRYFFFHH